MLHDAFLKVTKELNKFLQSGNYGHSPGAVYALSGLGQKFMAVAEANNITPNTAGLKSNFEDLRDCVDTLARSLDIEQGMDDVDFRSDIQNVVNKLAINGVRPV